MPDEPMPLSDDDLGLLRTHSADGRRLNAHTLSDAIDHALATIAFQSARIAALTEALARTQIGVNHIATYRTAAWPDVGTAHEIALERLGAGREYDMWCCWNAAMQARAALSQPAPGAEILNPQGPVRPADDAPRESSGEQAIQRPAAPSRSDSGADHLP